MSGGGRYVMVRFKPCGRSKAGHLASHCARRTLKGPHGGEPAAVVFHGGQWFRNDACLDSIRDQLDQAAREYERRVRAATGRAARRDARPFLSLVVAWSREQLDTLFQGDDPQAAFQSLHRDLEAYLDGLQVRHGTRRIYTAYHLDETRIHAHVLLEAVDERGQTPSSRMDAAARNTRQALSAALREVNPAAAARILRLPARDRASAVREALQAADPDQVPPGGRITSLPHWLSIEQDAIGEAFQDAGFQRGEREDTPRRSVSTQAWYAEQNRQARADLEAMRRVVDDLEREREAKRQEIQDLQDQVKQRKTERERVFAEIRARGQAISQEIQDLEAASEERKAQYRAYDAETKRLRIQRDGLKAEVQALEKLIQDRRASLEGRTLTREEWSQQGQYLDDLLKGAEEPSR